MHNLDEKKQVIILILSRLRDFNPAIGSYDKSVLSDFKYAVKLDNGRINLSHELVHDFEQSSAFVDDDRLKLAANSFVPNIIVGNTSSTSENVFQKASPIQHSIPANSRSKNSTSKSLIILGILIVLGLGGYYIYTQIDKENEVSNKSTIRDNITEYVTVTTNDYKFSEMGGIKDLEIVVTNNTDYTLDNVRFEITYIKKNGGVWKNKEIDTDMIGSKSYMTIKVPDTDRGTSVRCRVISVESSVLGL